jgi:hypothetical protein
MAMAMARQVASLLAALMILLAYGGQQMGWMDSRFLYNILNAIGSAILGYMAAHPFQIGFVLLEGAWVLISLWVLLRPKKVVAR